MAEGLGLSSIFAARHPAEAARVLEGVDAAEAAGFLGELPPADAASVLAGMLPAPAAAILARLGDTDGAAVLKHLVPDRGAAILRSLPPERREALLGGLRPGRRAALSMLLAYPGDTVGAWSDPRVLAVRRDATVGQARRAVADAGAPAACDLYVVDGERRLAGAVSVARLLGADTRVPVERVMQARPAALAAATGLSEARGAGSWSNHNALPVVDARGRLLGSVTAEALDRVLGTGQRSARSGGEGMVNLLAATYLQALADLLRELWGILAPAAPAQRRERR